jgi:hypothetical protein
VNDGCLWDLGEFRKLSAKLDRWPIVCRLFGLAVVFRAGTSAGVTGSVIVKWPKPDYTEYVMLSGLFVVRIDCPVVVQRKMSWLRGTCNY